MNVEMVPPEAAEDSALVAEVVELVNAAYDIGEDGMWRPGETRTYAARVAERIRAGEVVMATVDGRPAGVVRVHVLPSGIPEFGMLAARPGFQRAGIGRALVGFAERWARDQGHPAMRLELLLPRDGRHPAKEFLHAWYTRMGYLPIGRRPVGGTLYPHLLPRLAVPCDVITCEKPLARN